MFTEPLGTNNVPAFLSKLWRLVDSSHNNDLISWSTSGKSFIIRNQAKFAKELLPLYFKHNNMASFIRQLNMYGFRKITHIENSGLKVESDEIEFYHSCFLKGQENLLEFIKRKNSLSVTTAKTHAPLEDKTNKEEVSLILTDVKDIKNRQDSVDSLLARMQSENEALWKEIANLRHKHQRQQQIVERLIQFLASLVRTGSIAVKRKGPLMIDNKNGAEKIGDSTTSNLLNVDTGPIIQEITHGLLDDDEFDDDNLNSPIYNTALSDTSEPVQHFDDANDSPTNQNQEQLTIQAIENDLKETNVFDPLQESINAINEDDDKESNLLNDQILDLETVDAVPVSPVPQQQSNNDKIVQQGLIDQQSIPKNNLASSSGSTNVINSSIVSPSSNLKLVMPTNTFNASLVPSTSNVLTTPNIMEHFDNHLVGIDTELSTLQEQLGNLGNCNIDPNVLMGLFTDEDSQKSNQMIEYVSNDMPTTINDTITASGINSPLSTPKQIVHDNLESRSNQILNSNFDLCDIVDNNVITDSNYPSDNLFSDNQSDLLNTGLTDNTFDGKNLTSPQNYGNVEDSAQMFNTDDLLSTDAEINRLLSQTIDDQDLFSKEPKRKRIS